MFFEIKGRVDSSNAGDLENQLVEAYNKNGTLELDASNLEYISSAGLRALLKLRKLQGKLSVLNVNSEVYDIFSVTGFTEILDVKRKMREITVNPENEIGHGASSVVYRIDPETIVKVYNEKIPFEKIQQEVDYAKKAFILGVPTIISYDIVKCNGKYGTLFELVDSIAFSRFMNENPDAFDEYAEKYMALLKTVHATEVNDTFPDIKTVWHKWVDMLANWIGSEDLVLLHELVDAIPDRNTMVHSDFHSNNIMVKDGELVLLDMADIGRGHPIFDIGPLFFHYKYMEIADEKMADDLMVVNKMNRARLYEKLKSSYLYDADPVRHKNLIQLHEYYGMFRCAILAAKHKQLPDDKKQIMINCMKENLLPHIKEAIELAKSIS